MKGTKRIASLLLILAMVFSMAATAFAGADTAHTITITGDKENHVYAAYQVFKGDISDEKLTNIQWGSGVNGDELLAELKTVSAYAACTSAEDVAGVVKDLGDNSEALDAFAKIAGKHLQGDGVRSTETASPYTINVTGDGYYLIKDTNVATSGSNDAATKFILKVVGDVQVQSKSEIPTINKIIVEADDQQGLGTAQDVGSNVPFKLTSKVPAMDGYESYQFVITDTLSAGLTFNDDVTVTIGGVAYNNFTVNKSGQTFTITFNNFISQKANAGKEIVITYSAKLNEGALSTKEETNTVYLEYSNNPYDTTSTGKTPDHIVYVYDFDIKIDKYAAGESGNVNLAGAKFVLYKEVNGKKMYYYYNESKKAVEWKTLDEDGLKAALAADPKTVTEVTTDANGAASFRGVDAGAYKLHETVAPEGYNLLKKDVAVNITATYNADGTLAASSAVSTTEVPQYTQTVSIENKSGWQLPSTGDIGTTIFYIAGAILVVGAGILLVTRKRLNKES